MFDINKIKLVIWDLDDTFWSGTLSEGPITPIEDRIQLVKDLTDRGIVNSICSKNDFAPTESRLQSLGVSDYFVFKSIDWTPKGQRIANQIKEMGLRPVNCLFLDDNKVNLNEALFYSKELMVGEPSCIEKLQEFVRATPITDATHKRLNQYKVLEEKQIAKASASDNEAFLFSSNTRVSLHNDCLAVADRLYELINRTNQLNFTKNRCSREEFDAILSNNNVNCGYVTVKDNFGDYGIVGFYAIKNNRCLHFLFSCRTIGQGVEQWVYSTLGCPELTIVGEVVNIVENVPAPAWINQANQTESNYNKQNEIEESSHSILIKGPCDMEAIFNFIKKTDVFDTEFTFIEPTNGVSIQGAHHTEHIVQNREISQSVIDDLNSSLPFASPFFFQSNIFNKKYKYVFLSTLPDSHLGIYKRKKDGVRIVFGEAYYPLTDEKCWNDYVTRKIYTGNAVFTRDFLVKFKEEYEFLGITDEITLENNIKYILNNLSKDCKLILFLGPEIDCNSNNNPAFGKSRDVFARNNSILRKLAKSEDRLSLIDYSEFVTNQDSFYKNIYHYKPIVYYQVANRIAEIISSDALSITTNKSNLYVHKFKQLVHEIPGAQYVIDFVKKITR